MLRRRHRCSGAYRTEVGARDKFLQPRLPLRPINLPMAIEFTFVASLTSRLIGDLRVPKVLRFNQLPPPVKGETSFDSQIGIFTWKGSSKCSLPFVGFRGNVRTSRRDRYFPVLTEWLDKCNRAPVMWKSRSPVAAWILERLGQIPSIYTSPKGKWADTRFRE